MELRVGLAGLGAHGSRYARHLLAGDVAGARLVAISRADAEGGRAFAGTHGVHFVPRPEELAMHPDVDAVVLVLPPDLHGPAAEACVDRNRPVLVEKPLAATVATARALCGRVEASGAFLMVGHTLRFDAVVEALRRRLDRVGPLVSISINQRFEPSDRAWLDILGPGGLALNTAVHGFDLIRHLTGLEATRICAYTRSVVTRRTEDQIQAMVELAPDGIPAILDNCRATDSRSGRIEIVGRRGQLWADHVHRTLEWIQGHERRDLGPIEARHTVAETLRSFVGSVRAGGRPPIGARDGLAAVEWVEAALRSARLGRPVRLTELG